MTHTPLAPPAPTASLEPEAGVLPYVACPLCHTPSSLSQVAVEAGGEWQCTRCGQHWDGVLLQALANYASWVVDYDRRVASLETAGHGEAAVVH